jgi:hypothetical protein
MASPQSRPPLSGESTGESPSILTIGMRPIQLFCQAVYKMLEPSGRYLRRKDVRGLSRASVVLDFPICFDNSRSIGKRGANQLSGISGRLTSVSKPFKAKNLGLPHNSVASHVG